MSQFGKRALILAAIVLVPGAAFAAGVWYVLRKLVRVEW